MNLKKIEKTHYPIRWIIDKGELVIIDKKDKELPKDHDIYKIEKDFIESQIERQIFHGVIELI